MSDLVDLLKNTLLNSHAERGLRLQVLKLARERISEPDVLSVLCEALPASETRAEIAEMLTPYVRETSVRKGMITVLQKQLNELGGAELSVILSALGSYLGRDAEVQSAFIDIARSGASAEQRAHALKMLLGSISTKDVSDCVIHIAKNETDDRVRKIIFQSLLAESVRKTPELIEIFILELREPSSKHRAICAAALAPLVTIDRQVVSAFEDVLTHDSDRELIRHCLSAYMESGVQQRFEPLFTVLNNEVLDLSSRQSALDALKRMTLDQSQSEQLKTMLNSLKSTSLRIKK